jgi:hypothetical protein
VAAAGYDTFAVSANPHVAAPNGLAQGFDTFIDNPSSLMREAGADLEQEMKAWRTTLDPSPPTRAPARERKRELVRRLRALGYVD